MPIAIEDENVITINYTSGTTGRQGVMYHHRGAYLNPDFDLN
jgi:long-subunit acyl-CoA synthetase (AMP-forming)